MQVREEHEGRIVEVYAFTSAKKMASVLVKHDNTTLRLYNKGAAEWVLKRCVSLQNEYGEFVPMTEATREQLIQVTGMSGFGCCEGLCVAKHSSQCFCTIAVHDLDVLHVCWTCLRLQMQCCVVLWPSSGHALAPCSGCWCAVCPAATWVTQVVVGMASRGLRCICLAYTDYPAVDPNRPADFFEDSDWVDRNLIATAIVGIKDPVRWAVLSVAL